MAENRTDAGLAAAAAASNPRERIEGAMAPYREALERAWGAELPALTDYLAVATAPWRQNAAVLRQELKRAPNAPTLILVGERAAEADGSGMRREQFLAVLQAVKLLEGTPFHILFTGGVYGLEAVYGERPAAYLAKDFLERAGREYLPRVSVDQFSQNTGHQARIIGQIVQSVGYQRIVACLPIEHVARFAATVAFDLSERADRGDIEKARAYSTPFIFLGDGEWDEEIPQRRMTRAREAFGPVQKASDPGALLASKLLGGEYEDRLATECDLEKSRGYACPALKPSEMLEDYVVKP